jgi:transcriptional regulator with XRE-family HTH domain
VSDSTPAGVGRRVRNARLRSGLTQRELAEQSGISLRYVKQVEGGEAPGVRAETLRRLAVPAGVTVTALLGDAPLSEPSDPAAMWVPVRDALLSPARPGGDPVTADGYGLSLAAAVKLYHDNRYRELAAALPLLLRDAADAPPLLRSQAYQLAGSVMVQTRQHDAAEVALSRSLADAEATGARLDAASAVITRCWLLLAQGRFAETLRLSAEWADRVEPRISTATPAELSAWGWLLLRGSAAAVRDNRQDVADDMMRLAEAAAVAAGRERGGYRSYWTTFGPATVAMKRAENAVVAGRPDLALRIARRVPGTLRPTSDNRNRHLLDVAGAHLDLREPGEALQVMTRLRHEAGPWLAEQRMARDLTVRLIRPRRKLTGEMRDLADAVRLPL